jgi:hypothetical protein
MLRKVKLIDKKNQGLFPEHKGIGKIKYEARATIPVVEALQQAGAIVEPLRSPDGGYSITLGDTMPEDIIAVHLNHSDPRIGLRLGSEDPYPQEHPDYWATVNFTPCPVCKAPVVWYEAGYVSGYRVCTQAPHHHSLAQ